MPGQRVARTVMIIVALVVVAGMLVGMMATSGAITPN
jgi:hypothetical protein